MSGIAGVLLFDQTLDASVLVKSINGKMSHRGPDGIGHWSSGAVALEHRMLRTTPEAVADAQPLVDEERGLILVMDGRLDNRDELYRRLKPRFPEHGTPDSSYVLAAYSCWGEQSPGYLLGDFSFAIWDLKLKRFFCARDVMGGGSFAYILNERLFAFASEWEALPGLPGISAAPNEDRIASLLIKEIPDLSDRRSWQRDVFTLLAGESMQIASNGESEISQFGKLVPTPMQGHVTDAEYQEHFLEVFGQAVGCRMRAPGDPALMMSGGIDTAGIVAMMRGKSGAKGTGRFNSYSVIEDALESSLESRAIRSLGRLPGFNHQVVSVPSFTGCASMEDLMNVAWPQAHPVDNSVLILKLMYLAASRNDDRVMLHGSVGDITLSTPNRYLLSDLRRGHFLRAWRECQAANRNHVYLRGLSPTRNFLLNAASAFVPTALKRPVNRLFNRHGPAPSTSIINPDFATRIDLWERRERRFLDNLQTPARKAGAINAEHTRLFIMSTMAISARVAARVGIEARDPWADRRVVEFFLGLPMEQKVRNGWTKYLVRSTFRENLPSEVLWRRDKEHLGPKVVRCLVENSEALIGQLFHDQLNVIGDYVDIDAAQSVYKRYIDTKDAFLRDAVFELATLIIWMKRVNSSA